MCGLSGIVITKPSLVPIELTKAMFSLLMEENDDRGGHSWGAWGSNMEPVRELGEYSANTKPLHAALKSFKYREDEHPTFLFGHTRYGTHGEKTVENAHPFQVGTLTLAHNGVVHVDGYDDKDHAVDSGRIAMSIYDNGWTDGLAKVQGMCALLVTVGTQPLVYRHDQVLSYAAFEWGTVISSTLYDLELVVLKKLGLEPIKVDSVPENVLCQPGFGTVWHEAPCKERPKHTGGYSSGWAGHGSRYNLDSEWDDAWDTVWDRDKKMYAPRATLEASATPLVTTCGGNFSGKSDLPATTTEDKTTKLMKSCAPRLTKQEDGTPAIMYEEDLVDTCEYCGEDVSVNDLSLCYTGWSGGDPVILCLDCIMDEVVTSRSVQVVGAYGKDIGGDDLRFGDIPETDAVINEDQLSPEDKAELEEYILSTYRDPHDV